MILSSPQRQERRCITELWEQEMPEMSDMEARLRRVEDTLAIQDLVARYNFAIDDRTFDVLNDLFTKDAVLGGPATVAAGRDEVVGYLSGRMSAYGPTMHVLHVHAIDWHEDGTASAVLSAHAEHSLDGANFIVAFRYYDRYRFEDGRWRIAERRVKTLYATNVETLPDIFRTELRKRWPGQPPKAADL